jgi:muconolactone D-isomerase
MEFLVEFELGVPEGTPETEVKDRERAEAVAAAKLAEDGHLVRLWKRPVSRGTNGETRVLGLYRARSEDELNDLLGALPLSQWMTVSIATLASHPNDPAPERATSTLSAGSQS